MYTLIQQYGSTVYWTDPDGIVLPVPSLIEDQNGSRLVLCGELLPPIACAALESGDAEAALRVLGGTVSYCSHQQYVAFRRINQFELSYEIPASKWIPVHPSTAVEMRQRVQELGKFVEVGNDFVHVHTHSEFSQLDGYSTMQEILKEVVKDGQRALAITDHGVSAGHPALQLAAKEVGIHPVFGQEFYFVDDRLVREGANNAYTHLILWAMDQQGLRNLYALSTEGYRDGFYYKARIDWDSLGRFNAGILASTACLGGPLLDPYGRGDEAHALANLGRLGDVFGDRLYIELHANHLPEQIKGNQWLVEVARKYNVPTLAAVDSHYATRDDKEPHQTWLRMQTNTSDDDELNLFGGNQDYHLASVAEVRSSLSYLGSEIVEESISNTGKLADRCTAEIVPKKSMPRFSKPTVEHPDPVLRDKTRMVDMALANWDERITSRIPIEQQEPYYKLFEYEAPMLIDKGFPGYFLTTADFVNWSKDNRILVGPGRGSGCASLVAYLLRITEIDPIEGDLLIDRFMTPGRKSLPDFDIDFPTSKSDIVTHYVIERWGDKHVAQVGTHMRIKNKSAFKDVQRALSPRLPPSSFGMVTLICRIIDEAESSTAGLGLSWDDLFQQVGDLLEPFREHLPEVFAYAERFRGRLRTYGRHAAGLIIDADADLTLELPMRLGEEGKPMVTQWDMEALEPLGYVKYDFLKLRNLDTLQHTIDQIRQTTGDVVDVYKWHEEYHDPEVYAELSAGWTLGVFQIETSLGTRTTKQIKPTSRDELTAIITLGRPGPMRSGLDKLYMRRRAGEEAVSYPDPRLSTVLSKTFGAMIYQENIMATCIVLANYDADEADNVRKILGKKQVDKVEAEGRRFVERAVQNNTDKNVAVEIWSQMAEFAKYSFNRSHAYAYATLGFWTAWFKVHYPRESMTSSMATIDKDRIPQFVAEARRLGYQVLPPDINISQDGFVGHELTVRYGFKSVPGIGDIAAEAIVATQPYESYDDFLARKSSKANMGVVKKLVRIGAFDSLEPNRKALEARVMAEESGESSRCQFMDLTVNNHNLPCTFDWDNRPARLGKTGRVLKQLPIAKKCSKACREYTAPDKVDYATSVTPYTDADIRTIEHEMLGVFLSSSPFDIIPEEVMADLVTGDDLLVAENGYYHLVAIVASARPDPKGRDFGFATFNTPAGDVSCIVFSTQWASYVANLRRGRMMLIEIHKTADDRFRLTGMESLN